jgi:putative ABC transport system permease protein
MSAVTRDVRYAIRMLRRAPGFTATAVVVLALGIGATVAMFSVVDAVLVRPLPYPDAGRLVRVWGQNLERGIPFLTVPYPDVAVGQRDVRAFASLSAYAAGDASLAGEGSPESVSVARVNASFFGTFGVTMAAGRAFLPEEDRPGAARVAVVSEGLWQRRYGGRPLADDAAVTLDGERYLVIGVLPASFWQPAGPVDLFVPLADDGARNRENPPVVTVQVFGRLAGGVTVDRAQAELDAVSAALDREFPARFARSTRIWTLRAFSTRTVRTSLLVLFGAVTLVLLIACVNVANLLLARSGTRRREMAVRAALGAGRGRVVGQLLTESLLLGLAGGLVGLALAYWGVYALQHLAPGSLPLVDQVAIDVRTLLFATGLSIGTGVLFGLNPAFTLSREGGASLLAVLLKDGGQRGASARSRLRSALVVGEIALSLTLLVGAGLLLKSLDRLQRVDPGFDPEGVTTATIELGAERYDTPDTWLAFSHRLLEELQATPGVTAAGLTTSLPLTGHNTGLFLTAEEGQAALPDNAQIVWFRRVTPGYFRAMGIPLVRGRLFEETEGANRGMAIVSRAMADRFWPDEDPLGKHVRPATRDPAAAGPWLSVIGVVGDIHHMALGAVPEPEIFLSYASSPARTMKVAVRSSLDPGLAVPLVARTVAKVDPEQAVSSAQTMGEAVTRATSSERLSTTLLTVFAAVALLLAIVGLYGVISYTVDQRAHEIGIRVALGASRADVVRLVFREGMVPTLAGLGLGVAIAFWSTRFMASMLFEVSARDVSVFAGVAVILTAVAAAATWVPARRASGIDPAVTLRS